ncbi:short-subunit dehydrogenase [Kitasatospora atroaurantiaca]|uniref:Short-subunit dehydrogenase n=3 Tax=Kitasatospora atroaurantiaca TaxID=285545 RepID=A0A561F1B9_9ACTN|nr:short-subunit dehydrogenase [Kitasatospora atroaurantiaca]
MWERLGSRAMRKCILITGAGSGFGRDAALALAANGHDVIAAVHHPAQVAEVQDAAAARGHPVRVEKLDLLSEDDRQAAFDWDIDVLVNNAAIGEGGPIAEIPLELVRRVFDVNVFATLALTQGIVRRMVQRGRGRIIFVSSIAGLTAGAYLGAYAASKHALEAIAESMANELAPYGIQVATLNPGPYGTGFNDQMVRSRDRWYDPARNFTRPEHMAALDERFEKQFDPARLVRAMVELAQSEAGLYRNVHPQESERLVRERQRDAWTRTQSTPAGDQGM